MDTMKLIEIAIYILAGIATAIPLIIKLVKYVKASIKEKNWGKLLNLVMILMGEAETMFVAGADKKAWVLQRVKILSSTLDYDIDEEVVSNMIDSLCTMSKLVNPPD
jgi:hypothetical protein